MGRPDENEPKLGIDAQGESLQRTSDVFLRSGNRTRLMTGAIAISVLGALGSRLSSGEQVEKPTSGAVAFAADKFEDKKEPPVKTTAKVKEPSVGTPVPKEPKVEAPDPVHDATLDAIAELLNMKRDKIARLKDETKNIHLEFAPGSKTVLIARSRSTDIAKFPRASVRIQIQPDGNLMFEGNKITPVLPDKSPFWAIYGEALGDREAEIAQQYMGDIVGRERARLTAAGFIKNRSYADRAFFDGNQIRYTIYGQSKNGENARITITATFDFETGRPKLLKNPAVENSPNLKYSPRSRVD